MQATIFTRSSPPCFYCERAKKILDEQSPPIKYVECDIAEEQYRDMMNLQVRRFTGQKPTQVPQIFIDGKYIGGCDDLEVWIAIRNPQPGCNPCGEEHIPTGKST